MIRDAVSLPAGLAAAMRRLDQPEWRRLTECAAAMAVVGVVALVGLAAGLAGWRSFVLLDVAIGVAAWRGGRSPGLVAALTAILAARLTSAAGTGDAGGSIGLLEGLLGVRALLLAVAVDAIAAQLRQRAEAMVQAERRLRDLHDRDRRGRVLGTALARVQEATTDLAIVVLDRHGRVTEWGPGAGRVYGYSVEAMRGASAGRLFDGDVTPDDFARLIFQARRAPVRWQDRLQRRADATSFRADLEIRALPIDEADGFTLIVKDLTAAHERARQAAAAAEAHERLQREADAACRQLASLKSVTDPSLNDLGGPELVTALLERVREELRADGVALWHGRFRSRPIAAPGGVQPRPRRPHPELTAHQAGRTLLIHNDPARIPAMSVYEWPADVTSLITVPVVHAGRLQVIVEVVNRRSGRATEWELALVQVVAERAAGLMNEERVEGAVA